MSSDKGAEGERPDEETDPVRPEGEEESKVLAGEVAGQTEEARTERIEDRETEHEKAKRRKRGNNTQ
ncbi:MAG: hypothetical protein ABSF83_09835 [Nitrososphaerales archaeon]